MRKKYYGRRIIWLRNTYRNPEYGRKYTTITGYDQKTGETVKRFTIPHKSRY